MNEEQKLLKKIEHNLDRQLAFAGLFLASFIGIIEILPEIPHYKNWIKEPMTLIIFFGLVLAIVYSIHQSSKYMQSITNSGITLAKKYDWWYSPNDWTIFTKWVLKPDGNGLYKRNETLLFLVYIIAILISSLLLLEKSGIYLINLL